MGCTEHQFHIETDLTRSFIVLLTMSVMSQPKCDLVRMWARYSPDLLNFFPHSSHVKISSIETGERLVLESRLYLFVGSQRSCF